MKHIIVSLLMIAIGALGLLNADVIRQVYAEAYPGNSDMSRALDYCTNIGATFDRLDSAQRETCYAQVKNHASTARVSAPAAPLHEDVRRPSSVQR